MGPHVRNGVIFKLNRACVLGNLIFRTLLDLRVPDFPTCQHLQSPASTKPELLTSKKIHMGGQVGGKMDRVMGGQVEYTGLEE